jgi:hypothetical protein
MQEQKKQLKHATKCNHKAKAELYGLAMNVYDYYEVEVIIDDDQDLKYKNPAIIPPLQSRETLAEKLQKSVEFSSLFGALPQYMQGP